MLLRVLLLVLLPKKLLSPKLTLFLKIYQANPSSKIIFFKIYLLLPSPTLKFELNVTNWVKTKESRAVLMLLSYK